jgi:hypothetical protein
MSSKILDLSLGTVEFGILIATLLYGMSLVQTYTYFFSSLHDKIWLKAIVFLLWYAHSVRHV